MSSLILQLVSPNTKTEMNWKQYTHRRICSRNPAVGRMHAYIQVSVCLSVILLWIEIFQISLQRMKAETLSWSSGWLSFLHDLVHKTGQNYKLINTKPNKCKYFFASTDVSTNMTRKSTAQEGRNIGVERVIDNVLKSRLLLIRYS